MIYFINSQKHYKKETRLKIGENIPSPLQSVKIASLMDIWGQDRYARFDCILILIQYNPENLDSKHQES